MTTTQDIKPTPRQRQVLRELERGHNPTEVAKKLRTSPSNIYGHIRRMREAGIEVPVTNDGLVPQALANGNGPIDDRIRADLMEAIAQANNRSEAIEARLVEMKAEVEQLTHEQEAVVSHRSGYERALEALA